MYVLRFHFGSGQQKDFKFSIYLLFYELQIMCYTVGIYLKFSTYHQKPLIWSEGRNSQLLKKKYIFYLYNVCQSAYNNSSKVFRTHGVGEEVKFVGHPLY